MPAPASAASRSTAVSLLNTGPLTATVRNWPPLRSRYSAREPNACVMQAWDLRSCAVAGLPRSDRYDGAAHSTERQVASRRATKLSSSAAMRGAYPNAGLGIALDVGAKVNKGEMKW